MRYLLLRYRENSFTPKDLISLQISHDITDMTMINIIAVIGFLMLSDHCFSKDSKYWIEKGA